MVVPADTMPEMAKKLSGSESRKKDYLAARVEPELIEALKLIGEAEERSLSYMVNRAIREYVDRHAGKPKGK